MPRVDPGIIVTVARVATRCARDIELGEIGHYVTPGGDNRYAWRQSGLDEWEWEFGKYGHTAHQPDVAAAFLASRALRIAVKNP